MFFLLGSCQKEEKTIVSEGTQSFAKNSALAGLLSRISQNPTAVDNVLDNSSLISIKLPVTVTINGNTITVTSQGDYQLVQDAIDAFSNDDDVVQFNFPITIQLQNYTTQLISNSNQLHDAIEACGEDDDFDEINCITLVYPVTVNLYDSNNQIGSTETITNNIHFFNFLTNLGNGTYVAINYPISATDSNGQSVVLNSNTELMNFIEDSIDDCDEDSGSGNGEVSLSGLLVIGTWKVSYCYYDGHDESNYYLGYNFDFNSNGTVISQKNTTNIDGDWDINDDNEYLRLSLNFDGSDLEDIETNWRVVEYNETVIKLKKQNSDSTDYLTFTKN